MRRRSVSALRRRERRFERSQRAGIGVERVRAPEGDGLVAARVPEGRAKHDWDFEPREPLRYDFLAASRVLARTGEVSDDEGLGAVEHAAEQELGQQPIETVRWLIQVLEQDDGPAKLRLQRRAAHRAERGEVSAGQLPLRPTAARRPGLPRDGGRKLAEEQRAQSP